jgi:hypothetical protein
MKKILMSFILLGLVGLSVSPAHAYQTTQPSSCPAEANANEKIVSVGVDGDPSPTPVQSMGDAAGGDKKK